ncbi:pentapeptide repeat-containing protein [Gordonia spumicola]|uniref:pentapeptide repeat-containing protein n=1 Tax=Gordonia spumicola TaxID=589161 RepID=UPI00137989A2|nr:pentapeptide repeat-containing protein [Gordonia spumicola]
MPRAPRLERLVLPELEAGDATDIAPHSDVELAMFENVDLAGESAVGIALVECEIAASNLDDTDFTGARFADSRFTRITAPRFTLARAFLRNVHLVDSRIGALGLFDGKVRSMVVENCKIELVNLRGCDVRDVEFRGCIIGELDFGGATATRVSFTDCRVETLDVHRAELSDVDLRGLTIGNVHHLDGLRGSTMDTDQAVGLVNQFAAHLGVTLD